MELGLIKGSELACFVPVLLLEEDQTHLVDYYDLAAVREIHFWSAFTHAHRLGPTEADPSALAAAEAVIEQFRSL